MPKPVDTDSTRPVAVKLTPTTKTYIAEQAKVNFRSLSSEIAVRVERTRLQDLEKQAQGVAA